MSLTQRFIATLTLALTAVAMPVAAQEAGPQGASRDAESATTSQDQVEFSISGKPLRQALNDFSVQTGLQVSADAGLTAGRRGQPVVGTYTPEQALATLLSGTGLQWRIDASTVVLEGERDWDDGVRLDPLHIVAGPTGDESAQDQPYTGAGSSSYISQQDIERYRGMSVGDIFQGTTGVLVAENRNSGGVNVNIRGMQGQGRAPVLIDGSRQETTVYRGYSGVTSRTYVDPDLIGEVKIDKGPTMNAQGTGANAGMVRMETINADDIAKAGNSWGLRLRGSLIGNNSGDPAEPGTLAGYNLGGREFRDDCIEGVSLCDGEHAIDNIYPPAEGMDRPSTLDLRGHAGSLAVARRWSGVDLVAAYAQRSQGNYYAGESGPTPTLDLSERYDRGFYTEVRPEVHGASRFRGGERIVNTEFDSESALLKGSYYPGDAHSMELSYLRYDSEYGEIMPSQLIRFDEARQTEPSQVTALTYSGSYQWEPEDLAWADLELNLWHTDTESENNYYPESVRETLSQETGVENYQRWGADLSNTTRIPQFGGDFQFEYGLAWQRERVKPENREVTATSIMRDGKRKETSVFAALKWTFLPTLTLDGGIRYTRFDVRDNKPVYLQESSPYCVDHNGDGACDDIFNENRASGTAPLVSLLWEPWKGIQFYAEYAEAYRMPSLFESTAGFSVGTTPGQELEPEHTTSREVGFNLLQRGVIANDDVLRFKLAYFDNHTEDYLTRTITNAWEDTDAGLTAALFRMRNIESVEFAGEEASLEYDAGWIYTELAGTHYSNIELCHRGSYRRQRCTDYGIASSYANNMIPPNWEANATLGFRLFNETLDFGARVNWMGERNQVPEYNDQTRDGTSRPVPWHDYRIIDAFVSWEPNDVVTVDFNVDNLTDEYYLDALSLGLMPAPGRTARLSTTLHF